MRRSNWSVPFENPFFAVYEIENPYTCNEKHIVIKVCKSIQTVKKYILSTDKTLGYAAWCKDVYPGIETVLKPGMDVNSLQIRNKINSLKQNKIYIAI